MKTLFILIILSVFLISPVFGEDEWDLTDKSLFGLFTGTIIIDYLHTNYIFTYPKEYDELNPLIRYGNDQFGKIFIPIYFIGCTIATGLFANKLKSNHRKMSLKILTSLQIGFISHNAIIGINFRL